MTLAQLQVLLAIAETGGFVKAAELLGMTQSGVSHAIGALERELGVTLLERDQQGAHPTEAGARILAHARTVLQHSESIRQEAVVAQVQGGALRIGCCAYGSEWLLAAIVGTFARRYPGVELAFREGDADDARAWLSSTAIDVALVTNARPGLASESLLEEALVLVARECHLLAALAEVPVESLASEPLILPSPELAPEIHALFASAGVTPEIRHTVRDLALILALVREGVGVTILPALALIGDQAGLCRVPLKPPGRRRLALATVAPTSDVPVVRAFMQQAHLVVKDNAWRDVSAGTETRRASAETSEDRCPVRS